MTGGEMYAYLCLSILTQGFVMNLRGFKMDWFYMDSTTQGQQWPVVNDRIIIMRNSFNYYSFFFHWAATVKNWGVSIKHRRHLYFFSLKICQATNATWKKISFSMFTFWKRNGNENNNGGSIFLRTPEIMIISADVG